MANREACEVWIEQEIESAKKQGKNPCKIGKEVSEWVAKLFEVRVKPRTIEQRARRMDATNVAKKSNNSINTEVYYTPESFSSVTKPPTIRGGKRKGAGRHKKTPENIEGFIKDFCHSMELFGGILSQVSKSLTQTDSIALKDDFHTALKALSRRIKTIHEQNESGKK